MGKEERKIESNLTCRISNPKLNINLKQLDRNIEEMGPFLAELKIDLLFGYCFVVGPLW